MFHTSVERQWLVSRRRSTHPTTAAHARERTTTNNNATQHNQSIRICINQSVPPSLQKETAFPVSVHKQQRLQSKLNSIRPQGVVSFLFFLQNTKEKRKNPQQQQQQNETCKRCCFSIKDELAINMLYVIARQHSVVVDSFSLVVYCTSYC